MAKARLPGTQCQTELAAEGEEVESVSRNNTFSKDFKLLE